MADVAQLVNRSPVDAWDEEAEAWTIGHEAFWQMPLVRNRFLPHCPHALYIRDFSDNKYGSNLHVSFFLADIQRFQI